MFKPRDVQLDIIDKNFCGRFGLLTKSVGPDSIELFCVEIPPPNVRDEILFLTGRPNIVFHVLQGIDRENFEIALEKLMADGHLTPTHPGLTDRCPECGSDKLKEIFYGYCEGNLEELSEQYHIGGCCISSGSPDIHCSLCGYEWKT